MDVRYVLTEYDPQQPMVPVAQRDRSVDLPTAEAFYAWAADTYQAPQWTAELLLTGTHDGGC